MGDPLVIALIQFMSQTAGVIMDFRKCSRKVSVITVTFEPCAYILGHKSDKRFSC